MMTFCQFGAGRSIQYRSGSPTTGVYNSISEDEQERALPFKFAIPVLNPATGRMKRDLHCKRCGKCLSTFADLLKLLFTVESGSDVQVVPEFYHRHSLLDDI